jgi:hypothetical protein
VTVAVIISVSVAEFRSSSGLSSDSDQRLAGEPPSGAAAAPRAAPSLPGGGACYHDAIFRVTIMIGDSVRVKSSGLVATVTADAATAGAVTVTVTVT